VVVIVVIVVVVVVVVVVIVIVVVVIHCMFTPVFDILRTLALSGRQLCCRTGRSYG
jgi:hypothetical protein